MTELKMEQYEIPSADLGPENPLPLFRNRQVDQQVKLDDTVPEEDRRYLGWRTGFRVLPHRMQDGYNRRKRPRKFAAAVLENEFLRAVFLPELGGRLVSLLHKPADRELLERNPVFQPANLALRNAWFSGGIEWNTSHFGHYYLTCSPVFAARVTGNQGEPVLRLYEWDRVKRFPWQIDVHLPPGSPFLFTRVRLVNPRDEEIPMYWWTNIAVPERPDARTLVPADSAIFNAEDGGFAVMQLPDSSGADLTYSTNARYAREMFFRIPDEGRHWMASLIGDGSGLFQASTARLRGRKMFMWGTNSGGRRWQEYLSEPGCAYCEIQGGLARTQLESVPMPAHTAWTWTEAFGLLTADPDKVHSEDWPTARRAAEAALDELLPQSRLDALDGEFAQITGRLPESVLHAGSGWGALERRRLASQGEDDRIPQELVFADSTLGPDQEPWMALLKTGALPDCDPSGDPGQWMVQPEWREMLERSTGDSWLSWLHLGVMRMEAFDADGARQAWNRSIMLRPTAWALRNLAVLEIREERSDSARDLLRRAWEAGPQTSALAQEYAQNLLKLERYDELVRFAEGLPDEIKESERIVILTAKARAEIGDLTGLEELFTREFTTIREGEVTLTDLWFIFHERRIADAENVPVNDELRARVRRDFPPPHAIDFRMSAEPG